MKALKSIAILTFILMFAVLMIVPAYSETDPVADVENHSFTAYQVLSATGVGDKLTGVAWGSAFADASAQAAFLGALKSNDKFEVAGANIFASCDDAEALARILDNYENDSDMAKAFAAQAFASIRDNGGSSYGTFHNGDTLGEAGYYLFKDASGDDVSVVNPVIIRMAADSKVHIQVKASVPHVEKKVLEESYNTDYTSNTITDGSVGLQYGTGYNDTADYSVGDLIPFELIGTVAANVADYDTYYYAFIDTLSGGLTYDPAKADVQIGLYDVTGSSYALVADVTDFFTVTSAAVTDGTEVTFACADILSDTFPEVTPTSAIIVRYKAELNSNAVVGSEGNSNKVTLQYSNRPEDSQSLGKTEDDEIVIFTYSIRFEKVDSYDGAGLKGARFLLQNSDGKYYVANTEGSRWADSESEAAVLVTDDNGVVTVSGLDKGQYTITEIAAPDKYKLLESSITFTLDAVILSDINADDAQQYLDTAALGSAAAAFSSDDFGVTVTVDPANAATAAALSSAEQSASTAILRISNDRLYRLPGTGGSGTVFFYIGGGLLIAAAFVVLILRARAK